MPLNDGLAVVRKSCGVAMLAYSVPTVTVTPYVPARLNVDPPATVAVPFVPFSVNDVAIALEVNAVTRPYTSVVITGILVVDPTVTAPGPVCGNASVIAPVEAETVKLPVPVLDNDVTATVFKAILPAAVTRPFPLIVKYGSCVGPPHCPTLLLTVDNVTDKLLQGLPALGFVLVLVITSPEIVIGSFCFKSTMALPVVVYKRPSV